MAQEDADPAEQALFTELDAYLEQLHSGRQPDRQRLLDQHPDLASALECLDALESLAPEPTGEWTPEPDHNDAGPLPIHTAKTLTPHWDCSISQPPGDIIAVHSDFENYELLGEIGRGGMGVVFKARQRGLDRIVAIKMILASHLAEAEQVERFHAEARVLARVSHPSVVSVIEAGQVHGQHYFVMQYVAGPSLAELVQNGPLDAESAARHVATVARAVAHLHGQGIVHRDLKPSNVLLDEQGRPVVTDFGLVKMLQGGGQHTRTGAIIGTPSYMAPEQASGRPSDVGPLSDVYSLGAILYELLTGRPPFRETSPLDTLVQVLEGEPVRPRQLNPQIPRKLEKVCLRCLEKTPEERYPSAADLADDLDRFLQGEEVEAREGGVWQQLRRWARREPALASRLVALAIVALIVQANYLISGTVSAAVHFQVMLVLAVWAFGSVVFQWLLRKGRWPDLIRGGWVGLDLVLLTVVLHIVDALESPLIINYGLVVAGSGLWFRVRLVWFTTLIADLAYGVLVLDSSLRQTSTAQPHHRIIFAVALAVLGYVIAYQVKRVRALSRYYEHRPLP